MNTQQTKKDKESPVSNEILGDATLTAVALSNTEVVSRFGSATAEWIIAQRGKNQETGQTLAKGLLEISKYKVSNNPLEASKNIKQQAGFSAEVAATARDNSNAIIEKSGIRTSRSDDLPEYKKNHNTVDRVQLQDGHIISGTESQMKFVGNYRKLMNDIARENGKFSRYRGNKIELPSEQVEGASEYCKKQAEQLRFNAKQVEQKGNLDLANKLRRDADNFEQLKKNIRNSGLTTEQAIFYRTHPRIATAIDIARNSHRAGIQGARHGIAIGGCVSVLRSCLSMAQGDVSASVAAKAAITDTAKATAMGYATAAAGSAIKGTMQQSSSQAIRTLSQTSAPALAVNICISLYSSINRYVQGEITESQLLIEVGEKGAGMLSGGMMSALGQLAIPVPVVGAVIGGMIGYTLSSIFYQSALASAQSVEVSRENLKRCKEIAQNARINIAKEQAELNAFLQREIPQITEETRKFFILADSTTTDVDALATAIDSYARLLGVQLQFSSFQEFDSFMESDQPLQI